MKNKLQSLLNYLLFFILFILLSLLTYKFINLHILANNNLNFCFNTVSINTYLNLFSNNNFDTIIGLILACITAQIYVLQLEVAASTLENNIFNDKFNEWSIQFESGVISVAKNNEQLCKQFSLKRHDFFKKLYSINMKISNKDELDSLLSIFENDIRYFEEFDPKHIHAGGIYKNLEYVGYSFDTFQFLFLLTVKSLYDDLLIDLINFYKEKLPKEVDNVGDIVLKALPLKN